MGRDLRLHRSIPNQIYREDVFRVFAYGLGYRDRDDPRRSQRPHIRRRKIGFESSVAISATSAYYHALYAETTRVRRDVCRWSMSGVWLNSYSDNTEETYDLKVGRWHGDPRPLPVERGNGELLGAWDEYSRAPTASFVVAGPRFRRSTPPTGGFDSKGSSRTT